MTTELIYLRKLKAYHYMKSEYIGLYRRLVMSLVR